MAKKNPRIEQASAVIEPFLQEWADRTKDPNAAFRDWAVEQVLWEENLSTEDVRLATAVDGPGDMGIDAWHLSTDETPQRLYLVQAKNMAAKVDDLLKLRNGLESVFKSSLSGNANAELRARAVEFAKLATDDAEIEFHVVSSGLATPSLRAQVDAMNGSLALFEKNLKYRSYVHDIEDLALRLKTSRADDVDVSFSVPAESCFEFWTPTNYKTVALAVPATDLAELFALRRSGMFRFNPRYFLSPRTSTNQAARETLEDPDRGNFFLYNNGITAVCETISIRRAGGKAEVSIRDLQIVNGCQTTVTLYDAWRRNESNLKGVFVMLRAIESGQREALAKKIARATNTQNPMRAEDFRANDPRQERLQAEFKKLSPPWYYENKRGVWATDIRGEERKQYSSGDWSPRHMQMKDIAQACDAFRGRPADAVDRARFIFTSDERYDDVFPENARASQLLLPYLLFRAVDEFTRAEKGEHPWAAYFRYPVVSFVSRVLHDLQGSERLDYFTPQLSEQLIRSVGSWSPILIDRAVEVFAVEMAKAGEGVGARSLVRRQEWIDACYPAFRARVRDRLDTEEELAVQQGLDPLKTGLRSLLPFAVKPSKAGR